MTTDLVRGGDPDRLCHAVGMVGPMGGDTEWLLGTTPHARGHGRR